MFCINSIPELNFENKIAEQTWLFLTHVLIAFSTQQMNRLEMHSSFIFQTKNMRKHFFEI